MGCIYYVRNRINGKGYIGKLSRTMDKRRRGHEVGDGSALVLQRAIRKYGVENFDWVVLKDHVPSDDLSDLERFFIRVKKTRTFQWGYNAKDGGDGLDSEAMKEINNRPEVKAKRRAAALAQWADPDFVERYMRSINRPEVKARRCAAMKECNNRSEMKEKMRITSLRPEVHKKRSEGIRKSRAKPEVIERHRVVDTSPEFRARQSRLTKEALSRPEVKARQRAIMKEIWSRPEVKEAARIRQLEISSRPEVKAKRSASQTRRWENFRLTRKS